MGPGTQPIALPVWLRLLLLSGLVVLFSFIGVLAYELILPRGGVDLSAAEISLYGKLILLYAVVVASVGFWFRRLKADKRPG